MGICVIIGAGGMLGTDMCAYLEKEGHTVVPLTRAECDLQAPHTLSAALQRYPHIDWVINCAAYTQVDACETHQDEAMAINHHAVEALAKACADREVPLIHFSTDYVFDGDQQDPYTENDAPNPKSVYGLSKYKGEQAIMNTWSKHYIFRIQWLYGAHGNHFIRTICRLANERDELSIVNDQWGSPTWTVTVAEAVAAILKQPPSYGVYHLHNQGFTNWHAFADFFLSHLGRTIRNRAVTSEEFVRPAPRPAYGQLNMDKFLSLGLYEPPSWQDAVTAYLASDSQ